MTETNTTYDSGKSREGIASSGLTNWLCCPECGNKDAELTEIGSHDSPLYKLSCNDCLNVETVMS